MIGFEGSMSVSRRLEWLALASDRMARAVEVGPRFDPQPYVQLANTLRAHGDRAGAARVLVEREWRQRRAERERGVARLDGIWTAGGRSLWDDVKALGGWWFGVLFGYGHKPVRALAASAILIAAASGLNGVAYSKGQFAPNSDVVLTSEDWVAAVGAAGEGYPLLIWLGTASAQDYETFHPGLYGLDLFLPLDALGLEEAWRATTGRGVWGDMAF